MNHRQRLVKGSIWVLGLWLFSLLATFSVQAQVHTGDLELSTQAQIDAFAYTEVTGVLRIGSRSFGVFSDITNLDGLSGITSVERLDIVNNAVLTSLDGLSGITSVEDLFIENNAVLTSLDGLSGVSEVGRDLWIRDNAVLSACSCGIGSLLASGGVAGTTTIENNLPGCNSPTEVLATPKYSLYRGRAWWCSKPKKRGANLLQATLSNISQRSAGCTLFKMMPLHFTRRERTVSEAGLYPCALSLSVWGNQKLGKSCLSRK